MFVVSGAMAGLASLIFLARLNSAEGDIGDSLTLPAIAAVLIGGTSLFGGVGTMFGTFVGALLLTLIVNGMNLLAVSASWQPLVTGVILIVAVWLDMKATGRDPAEGMRSPLPVSTKEESMKLRYLLLAAPAMALAATTGVRADGELIAVFTKNLTNPFFQNERVAAENAAKLLNAKVVQYTPTKPDSIPEQLSADRGRGREEAERHRVRAGRLQGDGAGGREDERRRNPGRQHHRSHRRRQDRRLRRHRRRASRR